MPVATRAAIKGLPVHIVDQLGPKLILGNTYHLYLAPGTDVIQKTGGLHKFMNWPHNLLTDSGGFQMVSLAKLAEIDERGVEFDAHDGSGRVLLTPEKSIEIQNVLGSDICMQLDDVVAATHPSRERVEEATYRSERWLDRCIEAHGRWDDQNLFGIVQGGLHADLRQRALDGHIARDLPGYAIGGLSGGEAKEIFTRMVEMSCRPKTGLPPHKPRYLMGVGYPSDLVVCVALGVDLFDCVYPCRTARFGTALVPEGTLRLKNKIHKFEFFPLEEGCPCEACTRYTRAYLHSVACREPAVSHLMTHHNLTYMHRLGEQMRTAIRENKFPDFVRSFLQKQFPPPKSIPDWVREALKEVGIDV